MVARGPVSQLRNLGGIINKLDDHPAASSSDMEFNNKRSDNLKKEN